MLDKGIGITGNDKHFFINGRLARVNFWTEPFGFSEGNLLDFGCGIGDSTIKLSQLYPTSDIYGWDISSKAVDFARQKFPDSKVRFLNDLPSVDELKFDLIYLNCVLHHVEESARNSVIHQLYSHLAPNGLIFCFENNPANPGTQLAMYTNPFDKGVKKIWPNELLMRMKMAGFEILKTEFLFYFPQWLSIFRPIERWLYSLPLGGQYGVIARKPRH